MTRAISWFIVVLTLAWGLNACAQGNGHGNGHGHGRGNPHNAEQSDDGDQGHDGRWESRDGWEYRAYQGDERPPGWGKGKKKGWGNCDMPPGQAKKYGCNSYTYEGRQYHWYQDEGGRIIVRRPVISAHAGIEIH